MDNILFYVLIVAIVGIVILLLMEGRRERLFEMIKKNREPSVHEKRMAIVEKRKSKILEILEKKQRITNNEAGEMLSVSDSMVTHYLEELEKEGKIVQIGQTGHAVYYVLK